MITILGVGTEINEVINNLCSKLGVTANYLVPKLAEYKAITSAYLAGVWFLITVLVFVLSLAVKGKGEEGKLKYFGETGKATLFVLLFTASIFCLFGVLFYGYEFVGWRFSPEAKSIEYILELIQR